MPELNVKQYHKRNNSNDIPNYYESKADDLVNDSKVSDESMDPLRYILQRNIPVQYSHLSLDYSLTNNRSSKNISKPHFSCQQPSVIEIIQKYGFLLPFVIVGFYLIFK